MISRARYRLQLPSRTLVLGERTLLMGVLNITPDSFSDGGDYLDTQSAVARAFEMEQMGADILDIGGESTRPGAAPVSEEEEMARVLPVIEGLSSKLRIPISVDTQKAIVAKAAISAGAEIINDISALRNDPEMAQVIRGERAVIALMHMRGTPANMHLGPFAADVMHDVITGLHAAVARAAFAGIAKSQIVIDPGLGFGKKYEQNFHILAHLHQLAALDAPLLVGTSRKTFIGWALAGKEQPWPAERRRWGTAATVTAAILGGAHIVRVHDVAEMSDVVRVADAIASAR